ncbi:carboxypeptidase-like regulatory domain-containing protein [Pseudofulvibacter geojedonensis]|uniref:Carboxypeptidase-like regulatory domain-containing protein n=1 Tax=Pseudofulvibacter geojedonensis TaxID=1123758 RepID=A0ABW3I0P6_9FLAO
MRIYILIIMIVFPVLVFGQQILNGEVSNSIDNDGIHVFNKTYQKYTITDENGLFKIPARVNDTLVFSAIQYKLTSVVITSENIKEKLFVLLEEQINELDEVFIKPKLSGNLLSDTKSIKTKKQITAQTLRLPNAHVVPPSQPERRLITAKSTIVDALINALSGRTKRLKKQVTLYKKTKLEDEVFSSFKEHIVYTFYIPEDKVYDFIFFASEDKLFTQIVNTKSEVLIYEFLESKSHQYLKINKDEK